MFLVLKKVGDGNVPGAEKGGGMFLVLRRGGGCSWC